MIYVGIDIAKSKHYASAITSDGVVLVEPFPFFNSKQGFDLFLGKFKNINLNDCLFGLESTGHYGENLIYFLAARNLKIAIINPIQTNALRNSNIRKTKTDKIDTFLISKCLILGYYSIASSKEFALINLRTLSRFRSTIMENRTRLKIQLVTCVDQLFPELESFFRTGLHINCSYALLSKYSEPDKIARLNINVLSNILSQSSRGHYAQDDAFKLKELAKTSIGIKNPSIATQITHTISQIYLLDDQIDSIDADIKVIVDSLKTTILSVPGISYNLAAVILSEIGDINKFPHPSKLLAYAGLEPTVKQSGNFNATNTKISKRGSSHLRYAITKASSIIIYNNKTFSNYYNMKRDQGKSFRNAIGHVSYKLVRVLYKILRDNVKFDLE